MGSLGSVMDYEVVFKSQETLAQECKRSRVTISKYLKFLEQIGAIYRRTYGRTEAIKWCKAIMITHSKEALKHTDIASTW